jgi:hypothetical protein
MPLALATFVLGPAITVTVTRGDREATAHPEHTVSDKIRGGQACLLLPLMSSWITDLRPLPTSYPGFRGQIH